jgi:hypothetical protein
MPSEIRRVMMAPWLPRSGADPERDISEFF